MDRMFEFYVLNYDINSKKVFNYNIFNNIRVYEAVEKEVKKYLRAPKKYTYKSFMDGNVYYGFEAFCKELDSIIRWQEWSRIQYEISVGEPFETDCNKLEKWDCYMQCRPNIPMIAREVIYQYKQHKKESKDKTEEA